MKKILRNKSGMTLLEVMAALLIFAIFGVMVSASLVPMLKQFSHSNELSEMSMLLDNISDEISNNVSVAKAVKLENDKSIVCTMDGYTLSYKIVDGILQTSFDAAAVDKKVYFPTFDKKYYNLKTLVYGEVDSTTPMVDAKGTVKIKLLVKDRNGIIMMERSITARPLLLSK